MDNAFKYIKDNKGTPLYLHNTQSVLVLQFVGKQSRKEYVLVVYITVVHLGLQYNCIIQ